MNKIIEEILEPDKICVGSNFILKIKVIRHLICKETKEKTCLEMKKFTCGEVKGL